MSNNQEKALDAYVKTLQEIETRLDTLHEFYAEDHGWKMPDEVSWADVGSARHVVSLLDELLVFSGLKKEDEGGQEFGRKNPEGAEGWRVPFRAPQPGRKPEGGAGACGSRHGGRPSEWYREFLWNRA